MRPIAINLAQFHEMEINNRWWGQGFTDWEKVRHGTPLYRGHHQPKVPLRSNYYDMTRRETLEHQTELMHQAGIYGMAYYHYWHNHAPLMHQAIENLYRWKDIPQRYFLYWSNCDWFYSEATGYQKKMMLRQEYGGPEQWRTHIRYLIPFFQDPRYIRMEGKPVLGIYRPGEIPNYAEMIALFREEAVNAGLEGLYVIETLFNYGEKQYHDVSDAVVFREPNCCKKFLPKQTLPGLSTDPRFVSDAIPKKMTVYEYRDAVTVSLEKQAAITTEKKHFHSAFTGWDNTPRHGYKGFVVDHSTPELFRGYLSGLKSILESEDDFIFINAWNEWAEGMYLEPCEEHGSGFLDAVRQAMEAPPEPVPASEPDYRTRLLRKLFAAERILLYGAGIYGRETLEFIRTNLPDRAGRIMGFLDDTPEKIGTMWKDVPIFSAADGVRAFPNALVLLCCNENGHPIMREKLEKLGIPQEQILIPEIAFLDFDRDRDFIRTNQKNLESLKQLLEDAKSAEVLRSVVGYRLHHDTRKLEEHSDDPSLRYFDPSVLSGHGKGNYLDCGAYVGDTLKQYLSYCAGELGKLICCEPNDANFEQLSRYVAQERLSSVCLLQKALSHTGGHLLFENIGGQSSRLDESGDVRIPVDTIDHLIGDGHLDFLKIEVNGSEYDVLLGAAGTIRREKPVVAVSVYHQPVDLIRIPFLLKGYCPGYRIYLRHYGRRTLTDIVCYAIPEP